jgi:hypothetical protein
MSDSPFSRDTPSDGTIIYGDSDSLLGSDDDIPELDTSVSSAMQAMSNNDIYDIITSFIPLTSQRRDHEVINGMFGLSPSNMFGQVGLPHSNIFGQHQTDQSVENEHIDHPNFEYIPEAFRVPTVDYLITRSIEGGYMTIWGHLEEDFPGVHFRRASDYHSFMETPTFFQAKKAPTDEDDLYGEPYSKSEHLYVLVAPAKREETLKFYSGDELIGSFLNSHDFINPKQVNEKFTEIQMKRLSLIAVDKNPLLYETVEQLLVQQSNAMKLGRELYKKYPETFKECLYLVLNVGMLMRGWKGNGQYPLRSMDTQGQVDRTKLSTQLIILQTNLDNHWIDFHNLVLMKYIYTSNDGGIRPWRQSNDRYKLLRERVQVVMDGSHEESCIRMTSNLFTSTAWFYLNELYNEEPFEIDGLREIF